MCVNCAHNDFENEKFELHFSKSSGKDGNGSLSFHLAADVDDTLC